MNRITSADHILYIDHTNSSKESGEVHTSADPMAISTWMQNAFLITNIIHKEDSPQKIMQNSS